ncbi:vcbs repeat domain protein [Rhodobacteraceae bacterium KLH11]|nr:vcbs repeat domain protein [Rhodobacteraceae bacterium KLH11]
MIDTATLLANDSDVDGDALTVTDVSATSTHGATLTLNSDGTISYDPTGADAVQALAEGQTLTDTFTYTVADDNGEDSTATVSVVLHGINDVPIVLDGTAGSTCLENHIEPAFPCFINTPHIQISASSRRKMHHRTHRLRKQTPFRVSLGDNSFHQSTMQSKVEYSQGGRSCSCSDNPTVSGEINGFDNSGPRYFAVCNCSAKCLAYGKRVNATCRWLRCLMHK